MSDWYARLFPLLCRLPAETAHRLALTALEHGLVPTPLRGGDPILRVHAFGRALANPVGLAAGFDKNARVFARMPALGFGFAEVGGVTPLPQPGNRRPRLFRLVEDRALINRMGFNNDGLEVFARRLERHAGDGQFVAANLASNTNSADPAEDFVILARRLAPLVELLVIDVSCPNTANGKMFQRREPLDDLLTRLAAVRGTTPMALKVSPDLTDAEKSDITALALAHRVDGMVVANTTATRPATLRSAHQGERGGLSGPPVREMSRRLLGEVYGMTQGRLTLVGVGGIESGADAYAAIRAGATLVQLYTALVYHGPMLVHRIKAELAYLLRRDGFDDLTQAVGADHGQLAVQGQTA
ncbi:MAG: quinone-dependent dihydroorotate dehydrogenase [Alphaproteobacteria bacterium]|nr:quinone-dependent dihydroorotate dehydrogenase [Alphaproteobacteria bacterium]